MGECPRCKKDRLLITRGLCQSCYRYVVEIEKKGFCTLSRNTWGALREMECSFCGKKYSRYSRKKAPQFNYCSLACSRGSRDGKLNPNWKGNTKFSATCIVCGKNFSRYETLYRVEQGRPRYCSVRCRVTDQTIYPDKKSAHREQSRRREMRKRAAKTLTSHTLAEWQECLRRHNNQCAHCGTTARITRDHIVPLSMGGDASIKNIQPLCHSCNCRKNTRPNHLFTGGDRSEATSHTRT